MDIVLIRHAEREHNKKEENDALSTTGKEKAKKTAGLLLLLHEREVDPLPQFTAVLTSKYAAPQETAESLAQEAGASIHVLDCLAPLQPGKGDLRPEDVFAETEAKKKGTTTDRAATLAIVGHEPSISRLLCLMTGKNSRALDRGEAVWITGERDDFTRGKAALVHATRHENYATELHDKIQAKMTVCTFLAGFTITALIDIIKDPDKIVRTSRVAAAISLTAAAGLFVAAIYIYDELSMPPMFWNADTPGRRSGRGQFRHDLRLNDALYAHMVRAWRLFFTPAVVFSLTGFLALLFFNLRYPHLVMLERTAVAVLIAGCIASLFLAIIMYRRYRPKLAID